MLQVSDVQTLLSLQTLAVPVQAPVLQPSLVVHALPSSQTVPSKTLTKLQIPVLTLHESVVQTLLSLHCLAVPLQTDFAHKSLSVQVFPSLHGLPSLSVV